MRKKAPTLGKRDRRPPRGKILQGLLFGPAKLGLHKGDGQCAHMHVQDGLCTTAAEGYCSHRGTTPQKLLIRCFF